MLGLLFAGIFIASASYAQSASDIAEVESIPSKFAAAINRHDGHSLAMLMSDDVDFITVGGSWLHGRADFELYHTRLLDGRFKEVTMTLLDSKVNFIRPDLGFLRWSWRIEGDKNFDGSLRPPRVGIMTMVVEKRTGKWMVIASQNTNRMPGKGPEGAGITYPITLPDINAETRSSPQLPN